MPLASSAAVWIAGERECSTGQPSTPSQRVFALVTSAPPRTALPPPLAGQGWGGVSTDAHAPHPPPDPLPRAGDFARARSSRLLHPHDHLSFREPHVHAIADARLARGEERLAGLLVDRDRVAARQDAQ